MNDAPSVSYVDELIEAYKRWICERGYNRKAYEDDLESYYTDEWLLRIEAQERAKTWKCAVIWSWIILVVSNLYWVIK